MQLLQLALNVENKIVSIFQVETGSKCNCFCPICGEALEAKNRNKNKDQVLSKYQKVAHFAHKSNSVCANAPESTLHLLAKEVIKERRTLFLPSFKKEDFY